MTSQQRSEEDLTTVSSSLPTPAPALTKRRHALLELLTSERAYASDLALLRDVYMRLASGYPPPFGFSFSTVSTSDISISGLCPPMILLNMPSMQLNVPTFTQVGLSMTLSPSPDSKAPTQLSRPTYEPPLSVADTRIIFRNISELTVLSDMLVSKLETVIEEGGEGVCEVFLDVVTPLTPPYTTYITAYPRALAHLDVLSSPQQLTPQFSWWLKESKDLVKAHMHVWDYRVCSSSRSSLGMKDLPCTHWDVLPDSDNVLFPSLLFQPQRLLEAYHVSSTSQSNFIAAHVSSSGKDMGVLTASGIYIWMLCFERLIRREATLNDTATLLNSNPPLDNRKGLFIISLDPEISKLTAEAPPRPGLSVCCIAKYDHSRRLSFISCLQMMHAGLFFNWYSSPEKNRSSQPARHTVMIPPQHQHANQVHVPIQLVPIHGVEGQINYLPGLEPIESSDDDETSEGVVSDPPYPTNTEQAGPPPLVETHEEDEDDRNEFEGGDLVVDEDVDDFEMEEVEDQMIDNFQFGGDGIHRPRINHQSHLPTHDYEQTAHAMGQYPQIQLQRNFGVSIENVNRNSAGFVDFEKFAGLDGIAMVNVVANPAEAALTGRKALQTSITHNDGILCLPEYLLRLVYGCYLIGVMGAPLASLEETLRDKGYTFKSEAAVGLQKLAVCQDAHLSCIVAGMRREESRGQETRASKVDLTVVKVV
ncbi:hypothetical protein DFH29DRAFT_879841 [Suillus ampliporus]|nr:hypothetical protein DFH29DRAFT_879841 [Suillus ampliporus]